MGDEKKTRKVLVSPGFGAGWATWNDEHGKALAEDHELVRMVEAGEHTGRASSDEILDAGIVNAGGSWPKRGDHAIWEASLPFIQRAWEVTGRAEVPYCGGVQDLEVRTVSGPYRIDEYDGSETLVEASEQAWW